MVPETVEDNINSLHHIGLGLKQDPGRWCHPHSEDEDEEDDEYIGLEDITEPSIMPESSNKIKVTSKYLTKYEKTRILGARALQISLGSPPTVDIGNTTDSYEIAMLELQQKKIPIIIRRYLFLI